MMNDVPQTTNSQDRVIPASSSTKLCKICGCEKPLIDFRVKRSSVDGRQAYCKACNKRRQKAKWANMSSVERLISHKKYQSKIKAIRQAKLRDGT